MSQKKYITEKRSHDWIAYITGDKTRWEAGATEEQAVRELHKSHPEILGYAFVEAWGLNNPDEHLFTLEDTGREDGHCTNENCPHQAHDPRGPIMRLSLKEGYMEFLGSYTASHYLDDRNPQEVRVYALPNGQYLEVAIPFHFNAGASITSEKPDIDELNRLYKESQEFVTIETPLSEEEQREDLARSLDEDLAKERQVRRDRPERGPRPQRPPRGPRPQSERTQN